MKTSSIVVWASSRTLRLVDYDDVKMRQTAALGRRQTVLNDLNQSFVILACRAQVVFVPEGMVSVYFEVCQNEFSRAITSLGLQSRIVGE
jgi:hypothetical protein